MSSKATSSLISGGARVAPEIAGDFDRLMHGEGLNRRRNGGPSVRSRLGLDFVNFLQADATTAIGPFLAVYLNGSRHWGPGSVGVAISAQGIAGLLAQLPAGAVVDSTTRKRMVLAIAALIIGAGSIAITFATTVTTVVLAQIAIG